jgi:hypothetical protein
LIRTWNADQIISDLQQIYFATTDPRMDGFTTWACKQDMYRVKFALDEMLNKCPTYAPEAEFLEEHNKQLVWKALNDKKV